MQQKLKLKGLHTPKFILFMHGFLNGRMKTATLDPQQRHLNSAYIHGRSFMFNELCKKRVVQLEQELNDVRAEAQKLILELTNTPIPPDCTTDEVKTPARARPLTIAEAQSCRAADAAAARVADVKVRIKSQRDAILARREGIIYRLIEIQELISLRERVCVEEMEATANALKNCFCAYGHGALLKPVCPDHIPRVAYDGYLDAYYSCHNPLSEKIADVLKKEAHNA